MKSISLRLLMPTVGVLIITLIGVMILVDVPSVIWPQRDSITPTPTPVVSLVTVEGEIVCLPHKNQDGPQTMECAYGLKDNEGQHYGLTKLDQESIIDNSVATGQRYKVIGESTTPADNDNYAVIGYISVVSITKL